MSPMMFCSELSCSLLDFLQRLVFVRFYLCARGRGEGSCCTSLSWADDDRRGRNECAQGREQCLWRAWGTCSLKFTIQTQHNCQVTDETDDAGHNLPAEGEELRFPGPTGCTKSVEFRNSGARTHTQTHTNCQRAWSGVPRHDRCKGMCMSAFEFSFSWPPCSRLLVVFGIILRPERLFLNRPEKLAVCGGFWGFASDEAIISFRTFPAHTAQSATLRASDGQFALHAAHGAGTFWGRESRVDRLRQR